MKNRDESVYAEKYDYIVEVGYKKFKFGTAGTAINFARDAAGRQIGDKPDEVCIILAKKNVPATESEVTAE